MNDNNAKEIEFDGQDVATLQIGAVGVTDVFSDIGRSLDDMAKQLEELPRIKIRINRLYTICIILGIAIVLQGIALIWR